MFQKLLIFSTISLTALATYTLFDSNAFITVMTGLLLCTVAAVIWMSIVSLYANKINRLDVVDVAWGPTFIIIALVGFILQDGVRTIWDLQVLVTIMVFIWGMRLSFYIGLRFVRSRHQDQRYTDIVRAWGGDTKLRRYTRIFLLQALLAVVVAIPVIHINLWRDEVVTYIAVIGGLIWSFGLVYESIADYQLQKFMSANNNKSTLLQTGLRRYSRHPNYFGELCVWWGFAIISASTPYGWVGLIGALTITYLLVAVSGVPVAERRLLQKPGWQAYASRTSTLFPMPPKQ